MPEQQEQQQAQQQGGGITLMGVLRFVLLWYFLTTVVSWLTGGGGSSGGGSSGGGESSIPGKLEPRWGNGVPARLEIVLKAYYTPKEFAKVSGKNVTSDMNGDEEEPDERSRHEEGQGEEEDDEGNGRNENNEEEQEQRQLSNEERQLSNEERQLSNEERLAAEIEALGPATELARFNFATLTFSPDDPQIEESASFSLAKCFEANCTVLAHVNYSSPFYNQECGWQTLVVRLTQHMEDSVKKEKSLFDDDVDASEEEPAGPIVKHVFQPTLTINPVVDFTAHSQGSTPETVRKNLRMAYDAAMNNSECRQKSFLKKKREALQNKYLPIVYVNNFWLMRSHLIHLNASSTSSETNFTLTYHPMTLFKYAMLTSMDQSYDMHESLGTMAKNERDEMKRIFLETNPILLGVTFVVSILHTIFDFLAMKNDVQFWHKKKDFKGLSLKSVLMSTYFQLVIFLYLVDSEQTSYMILIPCGLGVFIDVWKIHKCVNVIPVAEGDPSGWLLLGRKYRLEYKKSYDERTKSYDQQAMRYLMIFGLPCLAAYAAYSMFHNKYKSWYSYAIRTQVQFIYFVGFVLMTPQIFINYKMKSVVHLPWRTFVYKALNTFIDDLFAFVISMPTMHRLACFRDDIVFFVLLYQRWIYPVDRSRTEEGNNEEDGQGKSEAEHRAGQDAVQPKSSEASSAAQEGTDDQTANAAQELEKKLQ